MFLTFKLGRRIGRFRLALVSCFAASLLACDGGDSLNPDSSTTPDPVDQDVTITDDGNVEVVQVAQPELASASFAGGIPMGAFALPNSQFNGTYNGAMRNIYPDQLLSNLSAIKAKGGKIVLMMAGKQSYYLNADGTFSLSKWKARIDRYRKFNFSSYINDGTVMAHYLIDEPYDPANFNGKPVGGATLEEMAKYSKSIWPGLKTVVRAEPYYIKWSGTYRYLDAAWAQYLWRKGNVNDYIQKNVSTAKQMGLGLVVGLNLKHGGNPQGTWMTPSEIESWGSALLSSDYPCAFLSWEYDDKLTTSAVKDAMNTIRRKAENRASRSCAG